MGINSQKHGTHQKNCQTIFIQFKEMITPASSQKTMQSACELLLYRTYLETWKKGEKYVVEGRAP